MQATRRLASCERESDLSEPYFTSFQLYLARFPYSRATQDCDVAFNSCVRARATRYGITMNYTLKSTSRRVTRICRGCQRASGASERSRPRSPKIVGLYIYRQPTRRIPARDIRTRIRALSSFFVRPNEASFDTRARISAPRKRCGRRVAS